MLSEGIIPLWSPFDGNGFSLIFNPFAQYFYIPGWILYLIHFITKNLSLHTFYSIQFLQFQYFLWEFLLVKSLKIDQITAFFSALVIACSLKVTELLRFPNATCSSLDTMDSIWINLMISGNKKKSFFIIFFSNFFILTAGYPYFIIYSLFYFFLI